MWASSTVAAIYQAASPDLLFTGLPGIQQTSTSFSKPRSPLDSQATGLHCGELSLFKTNFIMIHAVAATVAEYLDQWHITSWLHSSSSSHFAQCLNPGSSPSLLTSSEQRAGLNIYHANNAGHRWISKLISHS